MIHFARLIRKRLLKEKNFKRYLFYAIGEMLIVLVGILLALQLNNWNEKRKSDIILDNLFSAFEEDLEQNIEVATKKIKWSYLKDSLYHLVLTDQVTKGMYLKNRSLRELILWYNDNPIITHNLNIILKKEEQLNQKYLNILPSLKTYHEAVEFEKHLYEDFKENVIAENRYIIENKNWYISNKLITEDELDYYLNDPNYINRVLFSRNLSLNSYFAKVITRRHLEIYLLSLIKEIKKGKQSVIETKLLFEKLELNPFKSYECNLTITETSSEIHFNTPFLFINKSKDSVVISHLSNDERILNSHFLAPEEFLSFGMFKYLDGQIFEVTDKYKNNQKYKAVKDGYLLVE